MNAVAMQRISKRFGQFVANDAISLEIRQGSIHAVVGENGAGKSTLMKILYGYHLPDGGTISVRGSEVTLRSPSDAIALGIGMVHQHFMLVPPLSVTENVILGNEPREHAIRLDLSRAEAGIADLARKYGMQIDPKEKVANLSVALQQRVEILKLLYRKAEILIFDEPTPVLTPQEVDEFLKNLLHLKNEGKTIILISHKLSEVFSVSDTISILRHGKLVESIPARSTTPAEVARKMIGEELAPPPAKGTQRELTEVVRVSNISVRRESGAPLLDNLSFTLSKGEILGVAGVEGNGQGTLVQVLLGMIPPDDGSVEFPLSPHLDKRSIFSFIPDDRFRYGMIPEFSSEENLILGRHKELALSGKFLLKKKPIRKFATDLLSSYSVRPDDPSKKSRYLSGGNQQRLIVARELTRDTPIIIANQPTRGLDIKAMEFVYSSLIRERNKGRSVLLISSDLTELLRLSDRIAVMFAGKFTAMFRASDTNDRELGSHMMGVANEPAKAHL